MCDSTGLLSPAASAGDDFCIMSLVFDGLGTGMATVGIVEKQEGPGTLPDGKDGLIAEVHVFAPCTSDSSLGYEGTIWVWVGNIPISPKSTLL